MYLAELHGKLSSKMEKQEDILTSNVFSFFKYSSREIFLKRYLHTLGIEVSDQEAINADFLFWPRLGKNTEADLVIIVGNYYILIEAKYFSNFAGETLKSKAQLLREIESGQYEAKNYDKAFRLIAITADHYYKKEKFKIIPSELSSYFLWTNWQAVTAFISKLLEENKIINRQEKVFVSDLYDLLDRKNLRNYKGISVLYGENKPLSKHSSIFFEAGTAKYRGDFIGFKNCLLFNEKMYVQDKVIFLTRKNTLFDSILHIKTLHKQDSFIFFPGGKDV